MKADKKQNRSNIFFRLDRFSLVAALLTFLAISLLLAAPAARAEGENDPPAAAKVETDAAATDKEATDEGPPPTIYVVKRGDCLSRIARDHRVSLEALLRVNNLNARQYIYPDQRLIIPDTDGNPAEETGEIDEIIRTALTYRGVRYRYGGMSSRGVDCSGLVARVMQLHGIELPHNAAALFERGRHVARDQLAAGDLVFFRTTSSRRISHVGIYLGDGKFLHASSARGRVRTDSLESGYYARKYAGARRIVEPVTPREKETEGPVPSVGKADSPNTGD